jgi:hypothetical protein
MPEPITKWTLDGVVVERKVWDKNGTAYETTIRRTAPPAP